MMVRVFCGATSVYSIVDPTHQLVKCGPLHLNVLQAFFLITSIGELPMLYRFCPDQSIAAFSPHSKLFPSLYRCLWCRLLRGNSLLETTGSSANDLYPGRGYCFHVLRNSCIFLFRYQLYIVFFFSTMAHLFPQRDTGTRVVVETFKKINTWALVVMMFFSAKL